jgi:hypothetical protein
MLAFVEHGTGASGEPRVGLLRPGKTKANDAALAQLPADMRSPVLVRGDTGSGVQGSSGHVHNLALECSVGVYGPNPSPTPSRWCPKPPWKNALDTDGQPREGPRSPSSPAGCRRGCA